MLLHFRAFLFVYFCFKQLQYLASGQFYCPAIFQLLSKIILKNDLNFFCPAFEQPPKEFKSSSLKMLQQLNSRIEFIIRFIVSVGMSLYGVQLNSQVNKLMFQIRLQLSRNKYAPNLRTIYRSFVDYDSQVSGIIQKQNFEHALNANGLFFKKYELQVFEKAYNKNGWIDWFSFLGHLREPMGPLRHQLVQRIFDSMDTEKKGVLSTKELMKHFNSNQIEAYRLGIKRQEDVVAHFLSLLPVANDSVTREQFIAFYNDANINFAHNEIFIRYVSSQWHYTQEKLVQAKEDLVKAATKSLRYKLIEKTQGSKDELLIRKLFEEYDVNSNFYLSSYDLDCMMKKLGVTAEPQVIETVHQRIDKNNSGYIQFEEFKKFLYYDPYPF